MFFDTSFLGKVCKACHFIKVYFSRLRISRFFLTTNFCCDHQKYQKCEANCESSPKLFFLGKHFLWEDSSQLKLVEMYFGSLLKHIKAH